MQADIDNHYDIPKVAITPFGIFKYILIFGKVV